MMYNYFNLNYFTQATIYRNTSSEILANDITPNSISSTISNGIETHTSNNLQTILVANGVIPNGANFTNGASYSRKKFIAILG